jgi:hypothetical protein
VGNLDSVTERAIASAVGLLLFTVTGCGATSVVAPGIEAGTTADAPIDDAADDDGGDLADSGPTGYFVTGDLAGETQFAPYGISPMGPGFTLLEAHTATSKDSSYWALNLETPPGPFPVTLTCANGISYVQFRDTRVSPLILYSSRSMNGSCSFTFVEPSTADMYEGTFSATLLTAGTTVYNAVTNGRFRYPRRPEGGL